MKRHKKGPSSWYKPLLAQKANDQDNGQLENNFLFRGYVGGEAFMTKKNYRGMKLDTQWSRYILDAMDNDDDELLLIALQSTLADINDVVIGGEDGSPMSIGDHGFFSDNQMDNQAAHLRKRARVLEQGVTHLSESDWIEADIKIRKLVDHAEKPRFYKAVRGDSFAGLAVRKNAFVCAKIIIDRNVDPLRVNECNEDLFAIVIQQYGHLCEEMKCVIAKIEESSNRVFLPSEEKELDESEHNLKRNLENLSSFVDSLVNNLRKRLISIEMDKKSKKIADLKGESLSPDRLWNIAQEEIIYKHINEAQDLKKNIDSRLMTLEKHRKDHVKLSMILHYHHQNISNSVLSVPSTSRSKSSLSSDVGTLQVKNRNLPTLVNQLSSHLPLQHLSQDVIESKMKLLQRKI